MHQSLPRRTVLAGAIAAALLQAISPCQFLAGAAPSIAAALQPFVDSHTLAGAVTLVADKDKVLAVDTVGFADIAAKKPMPAGGLFSTAAHLARFCQMILRGGELGGKRYLSEKALRVMTTKQTGDLPNGYGLGWSTDKNPGGPFGHGGAYATNMQVNPGAGIITLYLVQHAGYANGDEGKKILPAFQKAAAAFTPKK